LTALYAGLVLGTGAVLLGAVLIMLNHVINTQPIVLDSAYVERLVAASVSGSSTAGGKVGDGTTDDGTARIDAQVQAKAQALAAAEGLRDDLRSRTLVPLIGPSLAGLAVLGVAGCAVGWFVAGRSLRPIQQIASTAKQVSSGHLDRRIGLGGPQDELRELADTFDDMLDRLGAAFTSQRAFVGNASHELRTPLAITRTLIEVALSEPTASADLTQLGRTLLDVNSRQQRILDGLLTLATSGRAMSERAPVRLDALVTQVLARYQEQADRRGIVIRTNLAPVSVVGDPVLNAVRHNRGGADALLSARTARNGSHVCLLVANSGPVLPQASIPDLFQPFRRAAGRIDSAEGAGLGLSIVRAIVAAHDGSVTAKAPAEGGLLVQVVLPAVKFADSSAVDTAVGAISPHG